MQAIHEATGTEHGLALEAIDLFTKIHTASHCDSETAHLAFKQFTADNAPHKWTAYPSATEFYPQEQYFIFSDDTVLVLVTPKDPETLEPGSPHTWIGQETSSEQTLKIRVIVKGLVAQHGSPARFHQAVDPAPTCAISEEDTR